MENKLDEIIKIKLEVKYMLSNPKLIDYNDYNHIIEKCEKLGLSIKYNKIYSEEYLNENLKEIEENLKNIYDELEIKISELEDEIEDFKNDKSNQEINEESFERFMENIKRDLMDNVKEEIKNRYDEDRANEILKNYFDLDEYIENYLIPNDGYGDLSPYDGMYYDYLIDDETIYIIRTN